MDWNILAAVIWTPIPEGYRTAPFGEVLPFTAEPPEEHDDPADPYNPNLLPEFDCPHCGRLSAPEHATKLEGKHAYSVRCWNCTTSWEEEA